jgi:hypothetical protein
VERTWRQDKMYRDFLKAREGKRAGADNIGAPPTTYQAAWLSSRPHHHLPSHIPHLQSTRHWPQHSEQVGDLRDTAQGQSEAEASLDWNQIPQQIWSMSCYPELPIGFRLRGDGERCLPAEATMTTVTTAGTSSTRPKSGSCQTGNCQIQPHLTASGLEWHTLHRQLRSG